MVSNKKINIKFICTSFRNRQNSEPLASFSGLFRSEYKWILGPGSHVGFPISAKNKNLTYMCLSCNVKKVGKLVRFKQKGQKQASFLAFHKCCHFWQVWLISVQRFQRRRFKCEKLTDGRTTDAYPWQKLTWPMARWAKNGNFKFYKNRADDFLF